MVLHSLLVLAVVIGIVLLGIFIVCFVAGDLRSFGKAGRMSADNLSQAGQVCKGCKDFWEAQKIPPKYLVHVFDEDGNPLKTDSGIEIVVCPHCDGDVILRLDKHSNAS